jgi:hypothetical protein
VSPRPRHEIARLTSVTAGSLGVMAGSNKRTKTHTVKRSSNWTHDERERDERVREIRAQQSREQSPEQRLEETLRLSRFMSELRQNLPGDVRAG